MAQEYKEKKVVSAHSSIFFNTTLTVHFHSESLVETESMDCVDAQKSGARKVSRIGDETPKRMVFGTPPVTPVVVTRAHGAAAKNDLNIEMRSRSSAVPESCRPRDVSGT